MVDSEAEGDKEGMHKVGAVGDGKIIKPELEKHTQLERNGLPHAECVKIETEVPPLLESGESAMEELSDSNNLVPTEIQDPNCPAIRSLEVPRAGQNHLVEEKGSGECTAVLIAESNGDNCEKPDVTFTEYCVEPNTLMLKDSPSEVRAGEEKPHEQKNEASGSELSARYGIKEAKLKDGLSSMPTSAVDFAKKLELINEGNKLEVVPSSNEWKEEKLKRKIPGMAFAQKETKEELDNVLTEMEVLQDDKMKEKLSKPDLDGGHQVDLRPHNKSFLLDTTTVVGDESGTEEEQAAFMKELETFHKEKCLEFKPPRFYGESLNCLKLWRAVIRLGGYEQVTSCKLWRQVGESFKPPKTCTTVSWTFRCFYEKALLEYEKHKMRNGELPFTDTSVVEPTSGGNQVGLNQASGSGRARRDAAARAMQGWHSQRLLGNGEVGDPIIKDKNSISTPRREKQLKSIGLLKRKKLSPMEHAAKVARFKASRPHLETLVVDIGPPADWVKVNVQRTKDCFEVYALVPGLLREEVRVQSDPAGRLVISGQPEQLDNPWGVAPFKKVVSLPSRIDPHQTSAVVTLHGQLFVRVPFEQSDL